MACESSLSESIRCIFYMCFYPFHRNSPEWDRRKQWRQHTYFGPIFGICVSLLPQRVVLQHTILPVLLSSYYCNFIANVCLFVFVFFPVILSLPLIAFAVIFFFKKKYNYVLLLSFVDIAKRENETHFIFFSVRFSFRWWTEILLLFGIQRRAKKVCSIFSFFCFISAVLLLFYN